MPDEQKTNPIAPPSDPNFTSAPTSPVESTTPAAPTLSSVTETPMSQSSPVVSPETQVGVTSTNPNVMEAAPPPPPPSAPILESAPLSDPVPVASEMPSSNPTLSGLSSTPTSLPSEPVVSPAIDTVPTPPNPEPVMPTTTATIEPVAAPETAVPTTPPAENLVGATTSEQPTPPATIESSAGGETGPAWLRQDPNATLPTEPITTSPGLENAPPPWQAHTEGAEPAAPQTNPIPTSDGSEQHGGFPVIIFVILVVAIIVAIGIFLFANNAIPGT